MLGPRQQKDSRHRQHSGQDFWTNAKISDHGPSVVDKNFDSSQCLDFLQHLAWLRQF